VANKNLFQSIVGRLLRGADVVNEAGGPAHAFSPEHALAQYAATGCLSSTFYATDDTQLGVVLELASKVEPELVAKVALYAREKSHMKDMPALLLAVLSVRSPVLFARIFDRVVDDPKMLRTFVQILRSGVVGRKSLGTRPKKLVTAWIERLHDDALFRASVGQEPSLSDIVKMVHPKPANDTRRALYGYLIGRDVANDQLPEVVQVWERFKKGDREIVPDVPFQMLASLQLDARAWCELARRASWHTTRMNLATFARHGVFDVAGMPETIAEKLRDRHAIARARVLPYQLLIAYRTAVEGVPSIVREALQDAMEIALENVPAIGGAIVVCPDVSGSMASPVTGHRKGATTAVRCVDVAALVAAALVRKNPGARVIPFENEVVPVSLNPRDSVMTNAERLAALGGGGTNTSAPLSLLVREKATADLVVYVSDNQSWIDARAAATTTGTETMRRWEAFKKRNPKARLVCIDVQPYGHTQAYDRADVLNVGGFSDQVFEAIARFATDGNDARHWLDEIARVEL